MEPFVIAMLLSGCTAGCALWLGTAKERRRAKRFQAWGNALQLHYDPNPAAHLETLKLPTLQENKLGQRGLHHLQGEQGGQEVHCFDLRYRQKQKGNHRLLRQTVVTLRLNVDAPAFVIQPQSLGSRLGHWLSSSALRFPTHPEFERVYQVQSFNPAEQARVQQILTPPLLEYVSAYPGFQIEYDGQYLAILKPGRMLTKQEELEELLQFCEELSTFFRSGVNEL